MTQEEVAEAAVGRTTYNHLERGTHPRPLMHLANCVVVLGCEVEDLVEPESRVVLPLKPEDRMWKKRHATHERPACPELLWNGGAATTVAVNRQAAEAPAKPLNELDEDEREMFYLGLIDAA